MLRGKRWLAAACVAAGGALACNGLVPARTLADAFNQGVLDSRSDPHYPPEQRGPDVVARKMQDELAGGYFGQGAGDARVVRWLATLGDKAIPFMHQTLPLGEALAEPSSAEAHAAQSARVGSALEASDHGSFSPVDRPLCSKDGVPDGEAIEALSDWVRFRVALERAVGGAQAILDERLATMDEVSHGAARAFRGTAAYLANRRWRRERARPTVGLVVKGGAATGIFSAGVVWVALNVIRRCVEAGKCPRGAAGFSLVSGTSTGATVVGAVDKFQTALDAPSGDLAEAIRQYERWYLCSSMNDLYCVRNHSVVDLVRGEGAREQDVRDSMLDFVGLAQKIEGAYRCDEMNNRTELVLNAVDFRTGRLYGLSDQDRATLRTPWDATMAIVSSAALPFIVRPVYHLPVDPIDAGPDAGREGNFAYLDGGIRSELPVLALVRRGVERVLVVSSGSSVTGETAPIANGANMAVRYINVSIGGVTESEIEHARTRAEAVRLAEHEACMEWMDAHRSLCSGACDRNAVCSGDFARACAYKSRPSGDADPRPRNAEIVDASWMMTTVWRDERRVPGLPGYSFEPAEQRRLMLAGAEAARQKCLVLARTLGIEPASIDADPNKARATLFDWCTPTLPTTDVACKGEPVPTKGAAAPDCATDDGPRPDARTHSTAACAAISVRP